MCANIFLDWGRVQTQEALCFFVERAERAEARIKALEGHDDSRAVSDGGQSGGSLGGSPRSKVR